MEGIAFQALWYQGLVVISRFHNSYLRDHALQAPAILPRRQTWNAPSHITAIAMDLKERLAKAKERAATLRRLSERLMKDNERLRETLHAVRHELRVERSRSRKISRQFTPPSLEDAAAVKPPN